ncbi:MAG: hypothetical protein P4M14_01700 [Gammaproteobacteria bacterium]|nr:hypothetical protein [Gammaproteobacteria bacterium]
MPITAFSMTKTFPLTPRQLVDENSIGVRVLSECKQDIALYAEGLNPCIAIVLHGQLDFVTDMEDEEDEPIFSTETFVCMNHTPGLPDKYKKSAAQFCHNELLRMFATIENQTISDNRQLLRITLTESAILRCTQLDNQNQQEVIAATFKDLLSDTNELEHFHKDNGLLSGTVELAQTYRFSSMETTEISKGSETDAIHVFLHKTPENGLNIIYYKGFLSLENLFHLVEQQKFKLGGKLLSEATPASLNQKTSGSSLIR